MPDKDNRKNNGMYMFRRNVQGHKGDSSENLALIWGIKVGEEAKGCSLEAKWHSAQAMMEAMTTEAQSRVECEQKAGKRREDQMTGQ